MRQDVDELVEAMRRQYERTQALAAFLSLKRSEIDPLCEISFLGYLEAREQLRMEASILGGHCQMLLDQVAMKHLKLAPDTQRLVRRAIIRSNECLRLDGGCR